MTGSGNCGRGSGRLTDLGDEVTEEGRGGNSEAFGTLSGLLDDGPGMELLGRYIEFGLDCVGYRKGRGAKAASIRASDSASKAISSGSTKIENLAEVRRDDPATDDLEFRREMIWVDNRWVSRSALRPSIEDLGRNEGDRVGLVGEC